MNKNIYLVAIALLATHAMATPEVAVSTISWTQNFITLWFIQWNLLMCFMGATIPLFWKGDGGAYMINCFDNFVAKPKFL